MGKDRQGHFDHWSDGLPPEFVQPGLTTFDALWNHEMTFIESPNEERGGRSGVGVLEFGTDERFFLKRQSGHMTRSSSFPFRRIPTFEREFLALSKYRAAGFSCPELVYFGRRGDRAILLTRELAALGSADQVWPQLAAAPRRQLLQVLARELARLHGAGLKHGSLYPKHIFILSLEPPRVGFIDLEKARSSRFRKRSRRRDLDALNRRSSGLSRSERWYFLKAYCGGDSSATKSWWRALQARAERRKQQAGAPKPS